MHHRCRQDFRFRPYQLISLEDQSISFHVRQPVAPEELATVEPEMMSRDKAGGLVELSESIFVNGVELNESSPVKALKEACEYFGDFGVNQSGAKKKMFERLCNYKRDAVVLSENLKKGRKNLHCLFRNQQILCQTRLNRRDMQSRVFHFKVGAVFARDRRRRRERCRTEQGDVGAPTIQIVWSLLGQDCPALRMLDVKTRYSHVFPAATKGAYRQAAEAAARFSLELGAK